MQSFLILASAAALLHTTMVSSTPMAPLDNAGGPTPQNGVWALLPDKCDAPTDLDMNTWPKCATPIGFLDSEVAALERPGPGKKAKADEFYSIARTKYAVAPAAAPTSPVVAEVVVPMVFSRSYYYLALTPTSLDGANQFAEARGWPVACFPKDQGGCTPKTLAEVQTQAAIEPTDPARLYRLIRITASITPPNATAPSGSDAEKPGASNPAGASAPTSQPGSARSPAASTTTPAEDTPKRTDATAPHSS